MEFQKEEIPKNNSRLISSIRYVFITVNFIFLIHYFRSMDFIYQEYKYNKKIYLERERFWINYKKLLCLNHVKALDNFLALLTHECSILG